MPLGISLALTSPATTRVIRFAAVVCSSRVIPTAVSVVMTYGMTTRTSATLVAVKGVAHSTGKTAV
jgi:hypothetical protein